MSSRAPACLKDIKWTRWRPVDRAVLLFILRDEQILLIHKRRGLGAGKINGPGGRIEPGESAREAALREVQEELCIQPTGVQRRGVLRFQFTDGYSIHCTVFVAFGFRGTPKTTEEAIPLWVRRDRIPFARMWADDRIWFPLLLSGRRFTGRFLFRGDRMLDHQVHTVSRLPACRRMGNRVT